ncbi:hypothetical protein LTR60_001617, partial [Cryomyces antarcticus]
SDLMVNTGEVVFTQSLGAIELALNPGLNIVGGVHPRGLKGAIDDDVSDITDMMDMADEEIMLAIDMADTGIIDDGVVSAEEEAPTDIDAMDVFITVVAWAVLSTITVSPVDTRFAMVAIVIRLLATDVFVIPSRGELSPSPIPACRIDSGRH